LIVDLPDLQKRQQEQSRHQKIYSFYISWNALRPISFCIRQTLRVTPVIATALDGGK
jgi:hypothetical protein